MIETVERPLAPSEAAVTEADRAKVQSLLQPKRRLPPVESYDVGAQDTKVGTAGAVWAPASSQRIRAVEGLVIVGLMAYFASGLLATLGVI